nr:MAG TPA: hypothetical protein [Caudoviricetes sp.]
MKTSCQVTYSGWCLPTQKAHIIEMCALFHLRA